MKEADYKKIIEDMPIGYAHHRIVLDDHGKPLDYEYIEVNKSFELQTGLKRDEILGKRVTEVIPDIHADEFDWIMFYGEVAQGGAPREIEQYSEPLKRWYKVKVNSPRKGEFITYISDMTDEKNELEEKLNLLMASNDIVFEIDENYNYIDILVEDEETLFVPKKEVLGKNIGYIFKDEFKAEVMNALQLSKESGRKETLVYSSIVEGDDRWFYAEIKYIGYSYEPKFIIGVHDITEEKKLREEFLKSRQDIKEFFEVNLDLLCIADMDGRFVKVNKTWEEILGHTKEEIEGSLFLDYVHPEDIERTKKVLESIEGEGEVTGFTNRYANRDGEYRYIEWRSNFKGEYIYAAARDVTERKRLEDRLESEKEFLKTMLLSIGDGVISMGQSGRIKMINRQAEQLTGWNSLESEGRDLSEVCRLYSMEDKGKEMDMVEFKADGELKEAILKSLDGNDYIVEYRLNEIFDSEGQAEGTIMVFRDISAKKEKQERVLYLSYHDQLTGLYNRRFFEEELKRLDQPRNLPISLIMIDANGLKLTNDAFGHSAGDTLLKRISEVMKRSCRQDDIIARVGGDEFAIILPGTCAEEAKSIVGRIYLEAERESRSHIVVSISAGYGTKISANENIEKALKRAEDEMYKRKLGESKAMREKTLNRILNRFFKIDIHGLEHSGNVGKIIGRFGEAIGLEAEKVEELKTAGIFHDIGLIVLDAETINKRGKLNGREWDEIKRHPEFGYQILKSVNHMVPIAEYVLGHHERFDGKGYPNGLKGEEIPIESRILSIVDAYDSMTSDRTYKDKMSPKEAAEELKKNMGTQFDPELVKIFVDRVLR